jgi:prepilin signal peptidase PulO-like enzyme (type II secretory pathway)
MIPHATLWFFASALGAFATIARAQRSVVALLHPCVVLLTLGALAIIVTGEERGSPVALGVALMLACAIVCAASDLSTGLVFDAVTALSALMILAISSITHTVSASAVGAVVCGGSLLALYVTTRRRGIGLGDVKLGAVIGAGCGGVPAVGAIGAAFVAGALWALPVLVSKRAKPRDRVPFAPFLAMGALAFLAFESLSIHG